MTLNVAPAGLLIVDSQELEMCIMAMALVGAARYRALLVAARPQTLLASLGPVVVGSVLGAKSRGGWTGLGLIIFLLTAVTAALMQAGANLVNDVKDFEKGVDGDDRVGPQRATQAGLLSALAVRQAYYAVFAVALFLGMALALSAGSLILGIAVLSIATAYMYTAGPFPLSYLGLGEVAAFVFFGPVAVGGAAYLQNPIWSWSAVALGAGPGFIAAAMMAINNFRDRASDLRAGKRTLALRLGDFWAQRLPLFCLVAAFLILPLYGWVVGRFGFGLALCCVAIFAVGWKIRPLLIDRPIALNQALKHAAKCHLAFAAAFVAVAIF